RYVNQSVSGAVTAVPRETFVRAAPVAKTAVVVPRQAVAAAPVLAMTASVAPQKESLAARHATGVPAAQPPAAVMNRPVVARGVPPSPPVPFAARQSALAANPGRPLDPTALATLR